MKLIATTALAVLLAFPATAQQACKLKQEVYDLLTSQKYEERRVIGGLSNFGTAFELWANDTKGTWSVVLLRTDGIVCIADFGTMFYEFAPTPEGDPA